MNVKLRNAAACGLAILTLFLILSGATFIIATIIDRFLK